MVGKFLVCVLAMMIVGVHAGGKGPHSHVHSCPPASVITITQTITAPCPPISSSSSIFHTELTNSQHPPPQLPHRVQCPYSPSLSLPRAPALLSTSNKSKPPTKHSGSVKVLQHTVPFPPFQHPNVLLAPQPHSSLTLPTGHVHWT